MPAPAPVLSWTALSEITFGKLVKGELSKNTVKPEQFIEPYPRGVKYFKSSPAPSVEKLIDAVGLAAYQAATTSADRINGLAVNWPEMLVTSANNHQLGISLERISQKLKTGETVDWGPITKALRRHDEGLPQLTQMTKVKPNTSDFDLTGYEPLDHYVGGLPQASFTLMIGPPGTGKSWAFLKIAAGYARRRKKVILFSLEMTMQQVARRCIKLMKMPKSVTDYIYICDDILSPTDITSIAARSEGASLVGVDFAELMMVGERAEQTMGEAYWALAVGAKNQGIPYLVLGQQNRASLADMLPTLGAARNTGMADILAALEIGLYNRSKVLRRADMGDAPRLPLAPGSGAFIVIKSRYGTKTKELGAIEIPFDGETGWGDKATRWHSLGGD